MTGDTDARFMERALFHAERGRGRTTPNPQVGAVVVSRDGIVVGQGAHLVAGGPHAEVAALDRAGSEARDATLYCTLEPCCHVGRTGPCTERIVDAGIRRVVAAVRDPDPRVAGGGFAYLRAHDIEVFEGVRGDEANRQHAPYFMWLKEGRPFVTAKTAVSEDGYAGRPDRRVRLTGVEADRFFQRQRAEIDAIAVGADTVLVDDPLLTAREAYRFRPLTRVLFDWRGRVPQAARVFSTLSEGPVIMVTSADAVRQAPAHFAGLADRGVDIAQITTHDLGAALLWLGAREIQRLLLEGGPRLQAAFVAAGLIDRIQVVVTPHRLGGGVESRLRELAVPGQLIGERRLGADRLIEFDVHRTDRSDRAN